ncbi:thioredoxin domain-containing protein [Gluconobacter morbifer]|uniref:Putative thiol:disulfide interchange protein n=1 Tax=Gluconobacter morbifer G707 TaxID=1088869 RepID=G6XGU6_9PROT|nr:thioredoxin domain-containing protein [Gluconobacter morbifer]EHH69404.1 putative thiol:disulfide interchange protein [Gluconobacter morbifer G707]
MTDRFTLSRRFLVSAAPALALVGTAAHAAGTDAPATTDARMGPRIIGNPKAPVLVQEWFSLTCTHCAHFATEEFPKVKEQLIDTGKIRYQFHDFCGDQVGLTAAMVARSLPQDRYVPFLEALFSSQMQWAFASGGDPMQRLQQMSALAGISASQFQAIHDDKAFAQALFTQVQKDSDTYSIQGTPYFRFNNTHYDQDPETYEKFADLVAKAT